MGRKRIEIDKNKFEKLCGLHCTLDDIAGFFNCSEDTIERFCKREYDQCFAEVYKEKKMAGTISLRRSAFKMAEKNPAMNIFLQKNIGGMSDNPHREQRERLEHERKMKQLDLDIEQKKLEVEKLRLETERLKAMQDDYTETDNSLIAALKGQVEDVWQEE